MAFTDEQLERYSRHIILKEVGAKGQKKLLNAKVLIIGAGGLAHRPLVSCRSRRWNYRHCRRGRGRSLKSAKTDNPHNSGRWQGKGSFRKGNNGGYQP